ncbi:hypothetical protein HYY75_05315 [bacterium]|nr:hypothetical protein [bacterium]
MKRGILTFGFAVLAAAILNGAGFDYLKAVNFESFIKTASENLEKLFMDDRLEFSGEGRKIFIAAWKVCQDNKSYPSHSQIYYLVVASKIDVLSKAENDLDTLVYDGLVKFKSVEDRQKFREAVKSIRAAVRCL